MLKALSPRLEEMRRLARELNDKRDTLRMRAKQWATEAPFSEIEAFAVWSDSADACTITEEGD